MLLDEYEAALRDLLRFYDRVRGVSGHGEGWTAADVLRLEEIRSLIAIPGNGKPVAREMKPASYPKPRKARKTRHSAR